MQDFKGKVRGFNVEPVDTTGAGDAFVSGILYYIASDPSIFKDEKRLRKALYFASVCGAIMVTKRGAISALPIKDMLTKSEWLTFWLGFDGTNLWSHVLQHSG